MAPFMAVGYKKSLTAEGACRLHLAPLTCCLCTTCCLCLCVTPDLWSINTDDQAQALTRRFMAEWMQERGKVRRGCPEVKIVFV